jgi:hypothetical protein
LVARWRCAIDERGKGLVETHPRVQSPEREGESSCVSVSTGNFISGRLASRFARPARLPCPRYSSSFFPSDPFGISPLDSFVRRSRPRGEWIGVVLASGGSSFPLSPFRVRFRPPRFLSPGCFPLRATRPTVKEKVWN